MGEMVTASCECGYSTILLLGDGMANDQTCLFPIYCRTCRSLQSVNILDTPVKCEDCSGPDVVAYDSPELLGEAGKGEVFSDDSGLDRALSLSDGRYLCPSCQQMRLRFAWTGCWD
jgi:hypothetical protein